MTVKEYLKIHNTKSEDFEKVFTEVMKVSNDDDYVKKLEYFKTLKPIDLTGKKEIKIKNKKFLIDYDFEDIKYEQWVYLNDFINEDDLDATTNNIPTIISLFLREKKWLKKSKFDKNNIDKLSTFIEENMEIEMALGFIGFFLRLEKILLQHMSIQYLTQQQMELDQIIQKL